MVRTSRARCRDHRSCSCGAGSVTKTGQLALAIGPCIVGIADVEAGIRWKTLRQQPIQGIVGVVGDHAATVGLLGQIAGCVVLVLDGAAVGARLLDEIVHAVVDIVRRDALGIGDRDQIVAVVVAVVGIVEIGIRHRDEAVQGIKGLISGAGQGVFDLGEVAF